MDHIPGLKVLTCEAFNMEWLPHHDARLVTFVEPVVLDLSSIWNPITTTMVGVHWERERPTRLSFCALDGIRWKTVTLMVARQLYAQLAKVLHASGVPGGRP